MAKLFNICPTLDLSTEKFNEGHPHYMSKGGMIKLC